jgi:hypothetical protein
MSGQNHGALLHSVPKLDGHNYHDWKFAIGMVLRRAGCWGQVTGIVTKPTGGDELKEWEKMVNDGLTFIGLTVATNQYGHIRDAANGAEAWTALASIYEKDSRATRISLKRQFYGFKHVPTAPIQEYISGITALASRLKSIKVTLTDADITDVLIFNLDESYSSLAATLTATKGDFSIADVTGAIIDEEGRKIGNGSCDQNPGDLAMHAAQKSFKCFQCGKPGHMAKNCQEKKECPSCSSAMHAEASDEDEAGVW